MSAGGQDDIISSASTLKRTRGDRGDSPPRTISESSPRLVSDVHTSDDTAVSVFKTPRTPGCYLPPRRHSSRKIPHFHDDYELGEMLKEGAEGQAYICYKKFKFQGGSLTFREQKFVVKKMNLEDLKRSGRFVTWEKLLQIKRGQSDVMMANVHHHIVRHLGSYEDEEAQELYVAARRVRSVDPFIVLRPLHVHRDGALRWWHVGRHHAESQIQGIRRSQ
jgi:hypothetical protein